MLLYQGLVLRKYTWLYRYIRCNNPQKVRRWCVYSQAPLLCARSFLNLILGKETHCLSIFLFSSIYTRFYSTILFLYADAYYACAAFYNVACFSKVNLHRYIPTYMLYLSNYQKKACIQQTEMRLNQFIRSKMFYFREDFVSIFTSSQNCSIGIVIHQLNLNLFLS